MAPEIVMKKEYCGPPVDIWATGILLFAMLCGCFPFKAAKDRELYKKIMKGQFTIPDHVSSGAKSLIIKILNIDACKRPNAYQLLNDSWLIGDINMFRNMTIPSSRTTTSTSTEMC
jgi:serine/threonine protein kinase